MKSLLRFLVTKSLLFLKFAELISALYLGLFHFTDPS